MYVIRAHFNTKKIIKAKCLRLIEKGERSIHSAAHEPQLAVLAALSDAVISSKSIGWSSCRNSNRQNIEN